MRATTGRCRPAAASAGRRRGLPLGDRADHLAGASGRPPSACGCRNGRGRCPSIPAFRAGRKRRRRNGSADGQSRRASRAISGPRSRRGKAPSLRPTRRRMISASRAGLMRRDSRRCLLDAATCATISIRSISRSCSRSSISSMRRRNSSRSDGISDMVQIAVGAALVVGSTSVKSKKTLTCQARFPSYSPRRRALAARVARPVGSPPTADLGLEHLRADRDRPPLASAPKTGRATGSGVEQPLRLDCGVDFGAVHDRLPDLWHAQRRTAANAVLICHALTGDQYVADPHPITGKPGWWETLVGPGGVLDTERYFLICANVLGGCMGTTGPKEINPATGEPWALSFPVITIRDMVRAQKLVVDHLGIEQPFLRDRRFDGRDAGPAMGRQLSRDACSRRCRSPGRRVTRRRTSRFTRSAGRRSWPTRNGAAAAI